MKRFLLVSFVSLVIGCKKQPAEPIVAQYKDKYLTRSEALERMVIPAGEDTHVILQAYGREWIRQQALADTAYALLPQLRSRIESQVQDYRTKLLIAYLSRLLSEQIVGKAHLSDSALQAEYTRQPEAFRALQPFYQYRWVKLPDTWINRREIARKLYQPDSVWIAWLQENKYVGEVVREWVPRSRLDSLQAFFATSLVGLSIRGTAQASRVEGGQPYLLVFQLTGLILPGQVLPLELVRNQVQDIVLQQKIHAWLSAFEDTVYQRAVARPDVRLY